MLHRKNQNDKKGFKVSNCTHYTLNLSDIVTCPAPYCGCKSTVGKVLRTAAEIKKDRAAWIDACIQSQAGNGNTLLANLSYANQSADNFIFAAKVYRQAGVKA